MTAIARSIPLRNVELPDEFFPAHLSVALIDSVFRSQGRHDDNMLLMYTGSDDFVRGDGHIRKCVANAVGRKRVSRVRAEHLVRWGAYELTVSPRYLDYEIWRSRCSDSV